MKRGKGRAVCYVIVLVRNGIKFYFKREEMGEVGEDGEVLKESRGWFTPDLMDAKKFLDKTQAEIVCSSYVSACVEVIKASEVLMSDRK